MRAPRSLLLSVKWALVRWAGVWRYEVEVDMMIKLELVNVGNV